MRKRGEFYKGLYELSASKSKKSEQVYKEDLLKFLGNHFPEKQGEAASLSNDEIVDSLFMTTIRFEAQKNLRKNGVPEQQTSLDSLLIGFDPTAASPDEPRGVVDLTLDMIGRLVFRLTPPLKTHLLMTKAAPFGLQ
ncbi:MAG: hypothetical protein AAF621_01525 [Pseudomonadota bacterium]